MKGISYLSEEMSDQRDNTSRILTLKMRNMMPILQHSSPLQDTLYKGWWSSVMPEGSSSSCAQNCAKFTYCAVIRKLRNSALSHKVMIRADIATA